MLANSARSPHRRATEVLAPGLDFEGELVIADADVVTIVQRDGTGRVAVGGIAHKPWRVEAAETEMQRGAKAVMDRLLAGAKATEANAFKVALVQRTLGAILTDAKG